MRYLVKQSFVEVVVVAKEEVSLVGGYASGA